MFKTTKWRVCSLPVRQTAFSTRNKAQGKKPKRQTEGSRKKPSRVVT